MKKKIEFTRDEFFQALGKHIFAETGDRVKIQEIHMDFTDSVKIFTFKDIDTVTFTIEILPQ